MFLLFMFIICCDLEGIFVPEIWIKLAEATGIDELKLTTRDEPDYDKLMKNRLKILREKHITLKNIQKITEEMDLLTGAKEFMSWIRSVSQVVVLTDNYEEFLNSLLKKLDYPLCFCHHLETDEKGFISKYRLITKDMKRKAVQSFKNLNYDVIAVGDSYNDIKMLKEAKHGFLFRPPNNVKEEFPEFPVINEYSEFRKLLENHLGISEN